MHQQYKQQWCLYFRLLRNTLTLTHRISFQHNYDQPTFLGRNFLSSSIKGASLVFWITENTHNDDDVQQLED